jgi:predicted amidophosphoribosyltransferase
VYALARYAGPVRSALLAYKERGHRELAEPFGVAVAAGLRSIAHRLADRGEGWWLVPAPSRTAQARRRGGDHVTRLAEVAAARLARSGTAAAVAPALRLSGGVRDSVGLDAAARAANLAGRVLPRRSGLPPAGTGVVLIDDVLTTGATATECVATLRHAGLRPLAVIVLAVTRRHAVSQMPGVLPAPFPKYLRRLSPDSGHWEEGSGT